MTKQTWSFDLTHFNNKGRFQDFLDEAGLNEYKRITKEEEDYKGNKEKRHSFIWYNPEENKAIKTSNNPISGKYWVPGDREDETGYASYMALYGDKEQLERMTELIKKHSEFIKAIAKEPNYTNFRKNDKEKLDEVF